MQRCLVAALVLVALAACGDEQAVCGTDCGSGSGASGGAGGSGGSGGGTQPIEPFVEVAACEGVYLDKAAANDPFAMVGQFGATPALPVGTDVEATVKGYDAGLRRIELHSDELGHAIILEWPRVLSLFVIDERVQLRRTRDWLIVRSKANETASVLHLSKGAALPVALEALIEGGPTISFVPQCGIEETNGCGSYAVALEATGDAPTATMNSGWPGGYGSQWNFSTTVTLRNGCASDGYAAVIVGDGLLFR